MLDRIVALKFYAIEQSTWDLSILPLSIIFSKRFIKISNRNIKAKKIPYEKSDRTRNREIFKRYPDLRKVFKDTKYRPKKDLNEGIKELIDQE